jgi:hypothetical protein
MSFPTVLYASYNVVNCEEKGKNTTHKKLEKKFNNHKRMVQVSMEKECLV